MTEQDKQRIDKLALEHARHEPYAAQAGESYVAGATREHERMAELLKEQIELVSVREAEQDVMAVDTVRLMDQIEYQKKALKEDYDKITKLEFELKEERNKGIEIAIKRLESEIESWMIVYPNPQPQSPASYGIDSLNQAIRNIRELDMKSQ